MTYHLKNAKRAVVFVVGFGVLLLGVVMLVAPGPGVLVIALGLGILATEFAWARGLLKKLREKGSGVAKRFFGKNAASQLSRHTRRWSATATAQLGDSARLRCPSRQR